MRNDIIADLFIFLYVTTGAGLLALFANVLRLTCRAVAMDIVQIFAAWNNAKTDVMTDRARVRLMESEAIERLHNSRRELTGGER